MKRREKDVFYWKGKNEIDFVVKNKDGTIELINVTYANEINARELKGFEQFDVIKRKVVRQRVITRHLEEKKNDIEYIPLYKFLLEETFS